MKKTTLVPIHQHEWTDDYSYMREVTCINHPTAVYFTKNPYERRIILSRVPDDVPNAERTESGECPCSFAALAVVLHNGSDKTE